MEPPPTETKKALVNILSPDPLKSVDPTQPEAFDEAFMDKEDFIPSKDETTTLKHDITDLLPSQKGGDESGVEDANAMQVFGPLLLEVWSQHRRRHGLRGRQGRKSTDIGHLFYALCLLLLRC